MKKVEENTDSAQEQAPETESNDTPDSTKVEDQLASSAEKEAEVSFIRNQSYFTSSLLSCGRMLF